MHTYVYEQKNIYNMKIVVLSMIIILFKTNNINIATTYVFIFKTK